jgi:very-long-chain ceramide synthase
MYHSKYWMNLNEVWTDWPTRAISPIMKWYYLVQFAFWLQQIVVVNIEEKRKDHWQMFTHHIFTCALLLWSYGIYQTKVGNVILCIMDVVDILLPVCSIPCLNAG